jgi:hypothetical protein
MNWNGFLQEKYYRLASNRWGRMLLPSVAADSLDLPARRGPLTIEIVSHCWKYAHLLAYQLSSLVLYPPRNCSVRMTVFHCEEDERTVELLDFFNTHTPENVTWNWWPLERSRLFRRAIGRNLAALETSADWIWFTDCDQLFHEHCLDDLAEQLEGRDDLLVFPRSVGCTPLLDESDGLIAERAASPGIVEIDPTLFETRIATRAIGALQIMHGDAARRLGYCKDLKCYQTPVERWQKAREDRAFRAVLGTQGVPIDVRGLYRIEHVRKGRYESRNWAAGLSRLVRGLQGR